MRRSLALALAILASGCAQSVHEQQVEVIPAGAPIQYDQDVPACVHLSPAERLAWRALQGAAIGVGFGAGIGAIAGGYAAAGNTVPALWTGAAAGAGAGGAVGIGEGVRDLKNPTDDCAGEPAKPAAKPAE